MQKEKPVFGQIQMDSEATYNCGRSGQPGGRGAPADHLRAAAWSEERAETEAVETHSVTPVSQTHGFKFDIIYVFYVGNSNI